MDRKTEQTQVFIAGAGPTGLSMAAQLVRYGIDFVIIDKKPGATVLSKALVLQARSLEIFEELGIAGKAVSAGRITTAVNLLRRGRRITSVNINGLGQGLSVFPYALSLEQSKTEQLLAAFLAKNGRSINWNCELISVEQDSDCVTIGYKDGSGGEHTLKATYLVGCDGAGSNIRHELALPFEGTTEPKLFYVADVLLRSPAISKSELYLYMIKKGFVLFFPMEGNNHYRVIGVLPGAGNTDKEYSFDDVAPTIKQQIVSPVEFDKLQWFSTYKVHSRKASSFMKGRCFIAGDAAHVHTPAGGQGMNTGIQDAYNLAWKMAGVLKNELDTKVLASYNAERTANAKHLLQTTDRMFDIMSGVNSFWNMVRLTFLPMLIRAITKSALVKKQIFPLLSQTGIAYPDSSLTIKSAVGKVKAGDRMPYFICSDGRQVFSYISEPTFKLLFFGAQRKDDDGGISKTKINVTTHFFREIPRKIFGNEKDFYILLRPDNHISYIGKDISECRRLMNMIAAD